MATDWQPAAHGSQRGGLQKRVARGLTWTMLDIWGRQLLNLVVFLVLARLLTPEDFGIVALATVFVAFAQLVVDQGLGDALIQRREVTRSHIDTAFWVAVATGLLLTVLGLLLAGPIATLLREPDLAPILQVLSLTFVLSAMNSIQIALLRRELAFRSLALRSIVAAVGGGTVGITLALLGYGAWALVGQLVATAILSVLTLWRVSPWRPTLHASRREFRELFSFGINVMGSDVLNYISRNADNLLVGVVRGTRDLGFYAVGYRILEVSQTALIQVTRKVTFPAFSRLQDDHDRMRRGYFRVTRAAAVVILPGYIGLALVAGELTVVLFGDRWREAGRVAAILFLIGPVLSVQAFSNALLNAAGRPDVVFRFRLITTVTNVIGFVIAVQFSIFAVAAAFVARGYLLMPLNLYWQARYGHVPTGAYLRQLRGPAAATAVLAAALLGVKAAVGSLLTPLPLLLVEIAVGAVAVVGTLWLVDRRLLVEVLDVATQAVPGARRLRGRFGGRMAPDEGPQTDPTVPPPSLEA
jgi:PST family polysaccharide transporter